MDVLKLYKFIKDDFWREGGGGDKGKMFLNGKLCVNRFFFYCKIKRIFF